METCGFHLDRHRARHLCGRVLPVCAALVFCAASALGQFTQVSGTVTDPNGLAYAGGTITATLVISGTPIFSATNLPYTPPTQPVGLNSAGSFTMQLADVTALRPSGGTWSFTVSCAAGCIPPAGGKGSVSFTVTGITISGSSQSITSTLTAAAPALSYASGSSAAFSAVTSGNNTSAVMTVGRGASLAPLGTGSGVGSITANALSSGTQNAALVVPTPTATCAGACSGATWGYEIVGYDFSGYHTIASSQTTTTNATTLTVTNSNTITWTNNAQLQNYNVYRTTSGGTPANLSLICSAVTTATCTDNGSVNTASVTPDNYNITGGLVRQTDAVGNCATLGKLDGIVEGGNYPPVPVGGQGYSIVDVCSGLFTGNPPDGHSIFGSALGMAYQNTTVNVMGFSSLIATPSTFAGSTTIGYSNYAEADNNETGTLGIQYAYFGGSYNTGTGAITHNTAAHFEAFNNEYNLGSAASNIATNIALELISGIKNSGTNQNDITLRILAPATAGTFSNGHIQEQIADCTNGGVIPIGSCYAFQVGTGNASPAGQVDIGADPLFVESTGSGFLKFLAPTGAITSVSLNWPTTATNNSFLLSTGQSGQLKTVRFGASCTTAATAQATCTSTFSWTAAFASANYTPVCWGEGPSGSPILTLSATQVAASITVQVQNAASAASSFAGVYCHAVSD